MINFFIIVISLLLIFFLAYYVKCQFRIDLFEAAGLSRYAPFKFLQANPNPIVRNPRKGVLLKDTFDSPFWSRQKWGNLWAREKGLVETKYHACGEGKAGCLLLESRSQQGWAYRQVKMIAVRAGDRFGYAGRLKTAGASRAVLSLVTYDKDMKVLEWNYAAKTVNAEKDWVDLVNEFELPEGVKYIRFGLSGSGAGKIWIDNVVFSKVE